MSATEKLREQLSAAHLPDLAKRSGIPKRSLQGYKTEGHSPTLDRAAVIAAALGLEFYLGPPRKSEYRGRIQEIAAALGLPADASAEEILAEIRRLADRCRRIDETLAEIRRELAALRSARI